MNNGPHKQRSAAGEYLTFNLGSEQYGMDILKVQEIRGVDAITPIVNTPDYLKGVINLRGKIVPIVDLRMKLHLAKAEYNETTVVIIINLSGRFVGIVVDGVSDVTVLNDEVIRDVPSMVNNFDTEYVVGLATIGSSLIIMIDIEKMMDAQTLSHAS